MLQIPVRVQLGILSLPTQSLPLYDQAYKHTAQPGESILLQMNNNLELSQTPVNQGRHNDSVSLILVPALGQASHCSKSSVSQTPTISAFLFDILQDSTIPPFWQWQSPLLCPFLSYLIFLFYPHLPSLVDAIGMWRRLRGMQMNYLHACLCSHFLSLGKCCIENKRFCPKNPKWQENINIWSRVIPKQKEETHEKTLCLFESHDLGDCYQV